MRKLLVSIVFDTCRPQLRSAGRRRWRPRRRRRPRTTPAASRTAGRWRRTRAVLCYISPGEVSQGLPMDGCRWPSRIRLTAPRSPRWRARSPRPAGYAAARSPSSCGGTTAATAAARSALGRGRAPRSTFFDTRHSQPQFPVDQYWLTRNGRSATTTRSAASRCRTAAPTRRRSGSA